MPIRRRITDPKPAYPNNIRNDGTMLFIKGEFFVRVDRCGQYHVIDGRVDGSRIVRSKYQGEGYETIGAAKTATLEMAERAYIPRRRSL